MTGLPQTKPHRFTTCKVAFVCLSIVLAVFCSILQNNQDQCRRYLSDLHSHTVIVFAKVCLWLLLVLFERVVQRHHSRVRNRGYLQFYRSTRNLKSLPILIHSTGESGLAAGSASVSPALYLSGRALALSNAAVLMILAAEPLLSGVKHLSLYLLLGVLVLELLSVPCLLLYSGEEQLTAIGRRYSGH
ncbi:hypothetical protein JZ751_021948 [Albula glossodonta]|uniref:Transmembrane protein 192 n=1 Tax=Albula glossodonta TaxID=121402 RepID=A0A8T2MRT9_9TELE|nr:hypothetical protein JZ751_021948 [Albula glossodonta]